VFHLAREGQAKFTSSRVGTVVAFTVSTPRSVEVLAKQHSVPLASSKIIYSLIDDIRSRVIQLLPPVLETKVTGEANVLQLFKIQLKSKQTMKVAGCRVTNGVVDKSKHHSRSCDNNTRRPEHPTRPRSFVALQTSVIPQKYHYLL